MEGGLIVRVLQRLARIDFGCGGRTGEGADYKSTLQSSTL